MSNKWYTYKHEKVWAVKVLKVTETPDSWSLECEGDSSFAIFKGVMPLRPVVGEYYVAGGEQGTEDAWSECIPADVFEREATAI